MQNKRLVFLYGTEDEYLTDQRISALQQVILKSELAIDIIKVTGNHRIDRDAIDLIL